MVTDTYNPPDNPTVSNDKITVSRWLKSPTLQYKTFEALTGQQFIADFLFRAGSADGGAVIFDKLTEANLYPDGDPGVIAPGNEFPIVGVEDPEPFVALAVERGYAFLTTYVAERRNQMSVVTKGARRLANGMLRDHNTIALNAFFADTDIPAGDASVSWTTATGVQKVADMRAGVSEVENSDLAYSVDTGIMHTDTALGLLNDGSIMDKLPREDTAINPFLNKELAGLLGIKNWLVSKRVPTDKVAFTQKGAVGSINSELTLWSRTIDDPIRRRWLTQAGRSDVPVIDEPMAAFILDIS